MTELLLLSGGLDSAALAAWRKPRWCLFIDYGQRAAQAEHRAARTIARLLSLDFHALTLDCSALGGGLMSGHTPSAVAPTPEWWPYRNQLLVTFAAAWGVTRDITTIAIGTVSTDRRHRDGTMGFYQNLDALLAYQEGGLRVQAPAIEYSSAELIAHSAISDEILGWTHSCHTGNSACAACPGCRKRQETLAIVGWPR
ncbi:MAG TPA: 7-cyano-7-deazaguanine synthase [Pseudonocardiaceae bacterium]|nr:7-cyano-7-deazaguanine synthase [Pseudonocardiaceae bacterium]